MLFLKKSIKSFAVSIVSLMILTLIITILNYIGLFNLKIVNIFAYITPTISFLIGGIYLGIKSNNKGWLEGLKLSGLVIFILFLFNFLAFDQGFNMANLILYAIVLITSTIGSMVGISFKG